MKKKTKKLKIDYDILGGSQESGTLRSRAYRLKSKGESINRVRELLDVKKIFLWEIHRVTRDSNGWCIDRKRILYSYRGERP